MPCTFYEAYYAEEQLRPHSGRVESVSSQFAQYARPGPRIPHSRIPRNGQLSNNECPGFFDDTESWSELAFFSGLAPTITQKHLGPRGHVSFLRA